MHAIFGALLAASITLISAVPAFAQTSVRLEFNAIVDSELRKTDNFHSLLDAAVAMIRAYGWRCDSISSIQRFFFSPGFDVKCNRYAYHYEIEDKGGRWVATLQ